MSQESDNILSKTSMLRQQLEQGGSIERQWEPKSFKNNIKDISELSYNQNCAVKAETNFHGHYVFIPAKSNLIDTELSLTEQRDELASATNESLLESWNDVCEYQKQSVIGDDFEMLAIAISKEMFKRSPELSEQIDLPQTLRLYNVLKQSKNEENLALLPIVEKNLQAKAWRYFGNEIKYIESEPKKVRMTPYSVSCIGEIKDYMVNKMHAPEDVINPKLEHIETSMMSSIYTDTLQKTLSPRAAMLVYKTARKYPKHGSSQRILKNINLRNQQAGSCLE